MTSTDRVRTAIARTREQIPAYWESCLAQRSAGSPTAAGSVYELTPVQIEAALLGASWVPYEHPGVGAGCKAFSAAIVGLSDVVRLAGFDATDLVTLIDPKATGFVEASVVGVRDEKDFSVVILGDNDGSEVVFTFHPGAPIQPSRIPAEGNVGRVITVGEAIKMGLTWAKVAS